MRIPLRLRYKGQRDYLHGTDMYDAVVQLFGDFDSLYMEFRHWARGPLTLIVDEDEPPFWNVKFDIETDGKKRKGWLVVRPGEIRGRNPCREGEVRVEHDWGDWWAITGRGQCNPIETVVAANKHLHIATYGPSKWALTNLFLHRPLDGSECHLCYEGRCGSPKFTESSIYDNEEHVGTIRFARVDGAW